MGLYAGVTAAANRRLTELGSTLIPALAGPYDWAERHGAAVTAEGLANRISHPS